MKKVSLLVLALVYSLQVSAATPKKISDEDRAKSAVRSMLIDPDSAKFEPLIVSKGTGSICGYFNARNRMGGYAGKTLFYVTKEMDVTLEPTEGMDSYDSDTAITALRTHMAFLQDIRKNCPEMR